MYYACSEDNDDVNDKNNCNNMDNIDDDDNINDNGYREAHVLILPVDM